MGNIRNIVGLTDGWLRVKLEPGGDIVSLPEHLQVELTSSAGGRDFFTVQEGTHRGARCSVKAGNLSPGAVPMRKAVRLVYDRSDEKLSCGAVSVHAKMTAIKLLPDGEHPLQIPDFPHPGGRNYTGEARCAKSWFFIGAGSAVIGDSGTDRYLHTGMFSAGCITVDPQDWTTIYELLIKCRSGDGRTVGTVLVRK